jgi:hypothetical protein
MFLLNWYREYLSIKADKICPSCETLRQQLAESNHEKKILMDSLFKKPEASPVEIREVTIPKSVPWNVRRQMLEREDREKAKLMKEAPIPDKTTMEVDDFEKELKEAEAKRS